MLHQTATTSYAPLAILQCDILGCALILNVVLERLYPGGGYDSNHVVQNQYRLTPGCLISLNILVATFTTRSVCLPVCVHVVGLAGLIVAEIGSETFSIDEYRCSRQNKFYDWLSRRFKIGAEIAPASDFTARSSEKFKFLCCVCFFVNI